MLLLLIWMIVPLAMTLWFSFQNYNLLNPGDEQLRRPGPITSISSPIRPSSSRSGNTLVLVGRRAAHHRRSAASLLALLLDQPIFGQGIVRIMVISPFFVDAAGQRAGLEEPAHASGLRPVRLDIARSSACSRSTGSPQYPLLSIIIIVAWQWLPFATLILLTALQSLDEEQKEAAEMDGAGVRQPLHLHHPAASGAADHRGHPDPDDLPAHRLRRDPRHHQRRPGLQTTNLAFLIYRTALLGYDVGGASAGGLVAVVLANIVAFFLIRIVGQEPERSLSHGTRQPRDQDVGLDRRRLGGRLPHLLPDPLDDADQLQDRARGHRGFPPAVPVLHWTTENYGEVQERSDYMLPFDELDHPRRSARPCIAHADRDPGRLVHGLRADQAHQGHPDVDALHQDDAGGRRAGADLPASSATSACSTRRIGLTVMLMLINLPIVVWMLYTYFSEIPRRHPRGRAHGRRHARGARSVYVLTPMAVPGIASTLLLNVILAWNEAFWTIRLTTTDAGTADRLHRLLLQPARAVLGQAFGGLDAGHRADPDPRLVQPEAAGARPDLRRRASKKDQGNGIMGSITLGESVEKSFGATNIIPDIDLEIEDGEFVVFVGPSGCGKSTLLRLIAGLEDTTGGTILIDGARRDRRGAGQARPRHGVPVLRALSAHDGGEEHRLPAEDGRREPGRASTRRSTDAARVLNLTNYLERRPRQLSGGQRQRVAIGRAIVREPKAFLFDEPLSNLDAALRGTMRLEITELHHQLKTTMIYVTHDQVEAMTMADKIVVLNAGNIEQVGSPLELYQRAAQPLRRRLHRLAEDEPRSSGAIAAEHRRDDHRRPAGAHHRLDDRGRLEGRRSASPSISAPTRSCMSNPTASAPLTVRCGGEIGVHHGDAIWPDAGHHRRSIASDADGKAFDA